MSWGVVADISVDGTSVFDQPSIGVLQDMMKALFSRPSLRSNAVARSDSDGVYELTRLYDAREFALAGRVKPQDGSATSFLQAHDLWGELLAGGVDHLLVVTFSDGSSRELTFRVVGEYDWGGETNYPTGRFAVACRAGDPRWYNHVARTFNFNPSGTPVAGITNPFESPLDGAGQGINVITALNAGKVTTPPTYVFTGPWTGPWVRNDTTDIDLFFRGVDLAAGETLTVDTKLRRVLLNGTLNNSLVDWSASDGWPYYAKGSNVIIAGGSWGSGATLVGISKDAWI